MKVDLTGRMPSLPMWIVGYYAALIVLGTLTFEVLNAAGVDALKPDVKHPEQSVVFAVTGAVCGSGLEFRKLGSEYAFSPVGQLIMGVLVELGGLGALVFGSLIVLNVSKTWLPAIIPGGRQKAGPGGVVTGTVPTIFDLIQTTLLATLTLQIIGTLAMLPCWRAVSIHEKMRLSLFHAISAVCNSGLSSGRGDAELSQYRYSPLVHVVLVLLAVLGSLGFPVWADLWLAGRRLLGLSIPVVAHRIPTYLCSKCGYDLSGLPDAGRCPECGQKFDKTKADAPPPRAEKPAKRKAEPGMSTVPLALPAEPGLSRHTRFALACFASAYIVGVFLIVLGILKPYTNDIFQQGIGYNREAVKPLTTEVVGVAVADGSVQSANALTAGFPVVKSTDNDPSTSVTLIVLTALGGTPGGTGGGVRTYTLGLLIVAGFSALRRRDPDSRIITERLLRTVIAMLVAYLALVFVTVFLLSLTEPQPFLDVAFEGVSAASGGGLSRGLTPNMTEMGRWVDLFAMYAGRAGLLALAAWMMMGVGGPDEVDGLAVG